MKIVTVFLFLAALLATSSDAQEATNLILCLGAKLGGTEKNPISGTQCLRLNGACCAQDPAGKDGRAIYPSNAMLGSLRCLGCFTIGLPYRGPMCTGKKLNGTPVFLAAMCTNLGGQCCSSDYYGRNGFDPSISPGDRLCPVCFSGVPKMPLK